MCRGTNLYAQLGLRDSGAAPSGAYKRFAEGKTLAQGGFIPPEHVQ